MADKLVTVEQLVKEIPVSKSTVYREVEEATAILKMNPKAKGLIPFKRFGRKIFFQLDKVLAWMEPPGPFDSLVKIRGDSARDLRRRREVDNGRDKQAE